MEESKEKIELSKETIEEFYKLFGDTNFVLDDEYEYVPFDEFPNIKKLIDELKIQNPQISENQIYETFRPIYDITSNFVKASEEARANQGEAEREPWINKTFADVLKLKYINYKDFMQVKGVDDLIYQMMPDQINEEQKKAIQDKFVLYFAKEEMKDYHREKNFFWFNEDDYPNLKKLRDNLKLKNPNISDEQISNVLENIYNITEHAMHGVERANYKWADFIGWDDNDTSYEAEFWRSFHSDTKKRYISDELNELLKNDYIKSFYTDDITDESMLGENFIKQNYPEYIDEYRAACIKRKIEERISNEQIEDILNTDGAYEVLMKMMPDQLNVREKSKAMHEYSYQFIKDKMSELITNRESAEYLIITDNKKYADILDIFLNDDEYSIEEMNKTECIFDTILCYTDSYRKRKVKGDDTVGREPSFESIKKIFDKYTKKCVKPEELLDDIPSVMLNLINTDFLDEEQKQELKDLYEKNYRSKYEGKNNERIEDLKEQYPDLEEKINKLEVLDDKEFEAFKELISLDRANNCIFKQKHIDCLIKQYWSGRSLSNEDKNMLFRALEDKSAYFYKENELNHNITVRSFKKEGMFLGFQNYLFREVLINKIGIRDVYKLVETVFHENQHAIQNKQMRNPDNNNFLIYDMCKMYVLRRIEGEQFSKDNYLCSELEVDARIAANVQIAEYMQKLGINPKDIVDSLQESLCSPDREVNTNNIDTGVMQFILKQGENLTRDSSILRDKKRKFKDHNTDELRDMEASQVFQKVIKEHPEFIEDIPALKMEFYKKVDDEGKEVAVRRGNLQILADYSEYCSSELLEDEEIVSSEFSMDNPNEPVYYQKGKDNEKLEKAKLYAHIINNDALISPSEVIQDILLLPKMNIQNPKLKSLMDKIIATEIIPGINKIAHVVGKANVEDERKEQLIQSMEAIDQFIKCNPEYQYSDEMQKKLNILSSKMKEKCGVDLNDARTNAKSKGIEELKAMEDIADEVPGTQIREATNYIKQMRAKEKNKSNIDKNDDMERQ